MDKATLAFVEKHKDKLTGRVLEVGSLNVNGSARDAIPIAVGIDIRRGRGVDLVCSISDIKLHFPPASFDACVSTGALEHIKDWRGFFTETWDMVKDGGYLLITVASVHKGRHAYPDDYWRFTEDQIRTIHPNLEDYSDLHKVSVGWIVKKEGALGSLDFDPIKIK